MAQDKKLYVGSYLPEATHQALVMVATQFGMFANELFLRYVEKGLAEDLEMMERQKAGEKFERPVELEVYQMLSRASRFETMTQQLRRVVAIEMDRGGDEKKLDEIRSLAERAGVDFDSLLEEAETQQAAYGTAIFPENNSKEAIAQWLRSFLMQCPGYVCSQGMVEKAAEARGISTNKLNQAKKIAKIGSKHIGSPWYWWLMDKVQGEPDRAYLTRFMSESVGVDGHQLQGV